MKVRIILLILLLNTVTSTYSQKKYAEADREMQKYFNAFETFNLDSLLTLNFEHLSVDTTEATSFLYSRDRDFQITESIYHIEINYDIKPHTYYMEYDVSVFSKNGKNIGLINYSRNSDTSLYYFDPLILNGIIEHHNLFYASNSSITDFINSVIEDVKYGYDCGYTVIDYGVPVYAGFMFNDRNNVELFRKWLKSYNIEFQTYGVDALEYLAKYKKVKLNSEDKRIIKYIKSRNSLLNTCSGCLSGIYRKIF